MPRPPQQSLPPPIPVRNFSFTPSPAVGIF
jgi:hypothetical protein